MTNLDTVLKKQRHHFANKGPYSQSYDFSSSHVWMWELDHKEGWVLKNWCSRTVVLEKTLESPLDSKETKPDNPKGNQPCVFTGVMLKLKLQYFGHLMWRVDSLQKTLMLGNIEDRWRTGTEDEMLGWHHWLNGHQFEQTSGDKEGQRSLVCCSQRSHKESDTIQQLNNNNKVQNISWLAGTLMEGD